MRTLTVPERHQLRIARRTLGLSLAGASILGGMTYAQAYRLIFREGLGERIATLQAQYGETGERLDPAFGLSWELGMYGYGPADWPALRREGEL